MSPLTFFKKIKSRTKSKQQGGFTLLETLVAIFILSLALTGPIYIATLAIRSSVESRDSISAYYLAEEAIEVIRNRRDTRSLYRGGDLDGHDWLKYTLPTTGSVTDGIDCFNGVGATENVCTMTRNSSGGGYTFEACPTGEGSCPALSFNPTSSTGIIYGETGITAETSKFSREFYLQTAPGDTGTGDNPQREVNLVVTVRWQDKGRNKQFSLVERLHNLQYINYGI